MPFSIESWPSPAPTTRSSMMVNGAGSAPARSRMARSFADSTVKLPGNLARPAEDRLADDGRRDHLVVEHDGEGRARRSPGVACANLRAPEELKRKVTIGSLVRWSKPGCASVRSPPDTTTRFSIR